MEASDLASSLQDAVWEAQSPPLGGPGVSVSAGYEEADFFVTVGGERFLVAVMKVSE